MKLPYRVLVLDDDEHALSGIVELLRDAGHNVTGAATYDAAKRLLAVSPFDLLISDVRLRSFNGLHLVMQTRADHPETAIIIITGYDDPLIDLEASRYHAELVRKPIQPAEFMQRVNAALSQVRRQRRWPRKRVVGGFRVTIKGRPAAVVDVSYGGLRLEVPDGERPARNVRRRGRRYRPSPGSANRSGRSPRRNAGSVLRGHAGGRAHAVRPDVARDRRSAEPRDRRKTPPDFLIAGKFPYSSSRC